MARNVMDQLRAKRARHAARSSACTVQAVTSDMAESLGLKQVGGAIVASVEPGSAADRAGLKQGDVIESFNGQPVHDTNTLRNRVAESQPGSSATLTVVRDGSERTVTVKLDEAKRRRRRGDGAPGPSDDQAALGVSVAPLTPELADRVGAPKDAARPGRSRRSNPDGRAADAGMQSGDVIEEVNRQPVRSVDELRAAVRSGVEQAAAAAGQPAGERHLRHRPGRRRALSGGRGGTRTTRPARSPASSRDQASAGAVVLATAASVLADSSIDTAV